MGAMEQLIQRIDNNEQLRKRLIIQRESLAESGERGTVSIPEADYKWIARFERAIVSHDRQQVLQKKGPALRAIELSPTSFKVRSSMEAAARLEVQNQIEHLSRDPRPVNARADAGGKCCLQVPESSWEISYSLVGDPQRVRIHDIRESGEFKINQVQKR